MNKDETESLMAIKKEVLVKNNIHWLHTKDRAEYQVEEGKIRITNKDLIEIVERYKQLSQ
tara:strand:+ start:89 stop:268 length:180 start_codon:yes stop_codon:yes gene_type:complete